MPASELKVFREESVIYMSGMHSIVQWTNCKLHCQHSVAARSFYACFQENCLKACDLQESVTINLTATTNENVYTSQAMNAKLFIKAGNELVAGTEQRTRDNSEMIALQVACRRHF